MRCRDGGVHLPIDRAFFRQRAVTSEDFHRGRGTGQRQASEMPPAECLPILEVWWASAQADTRARSRWRPGPGDPAKRPSQDLRLHSVLRHENGEDQPRCRRRGSLGDLRSICRGGPSPRPAPYRCTAIETQTRTARLARPILAGSPGTDYVEDREQIAALALRSAPITTRQARSRGAPGKLEPERTRLGRVGRKEPRVTGCPRHPVRAGSSIA